MEDIVNMKTYEGFIISQNNIIIEVNRNFLKLTGYTENQILGLTLVEASKLLRIDSQVDLQDVEGDTSIFIFTKELVAIEGTISCETTESWEQKMFSFKVDPFNMAHEKFDLANRLGTSRGDGVAIFSFPKLTLINSNQVYLNILEPPYNTRSNSIGKNIKEIFTTYSNSQFIDKKDFIINSRVPYHIEELELYSEVLGKSYWNTTGVPILDGGIVKYLILTLSNVTEKVLNRKRIEQKNQELEAIIYNMSDEIIIFDKDFNIAITNKKMEESIASDLPTLKSYNNLHDIIKDSIIIDKDNQLVSYEDFPTQRVARGEIVSNLFMKIVNSSVVKCREVYGYPMYDKYGNFSRGIMVYRDINHRIQAEELKLIKIQNELLTKVIDALDLEYIRCTYPDLEIININGNDLNKLKNVNNGIESFVYPIDEEKKRKELEFHLIEIGDGSYIDYENHIINGEKRYFKTINQPIFGLNNKIIEVIFITTDITDQVNAKNKMIETLDSQNQIFANISHELKTPLSMIFSSSQLIEMYLKRELDSSGRENISKSIDVIKQNCFRFTKLINNIVDLSSIESGFYSLHFSNENIIEIVEDIVDSVREYAKNKELSIIFDTEIEEKNMAVDIDKMERIMLNLISNAIKFSHKGGTIYIILKDKNDYVDIMVRDCGSGIDKKHLNTIFDKYHKVDNSLNRNTEGSGIGLTLVKIMTELLGGKISVESDIGEGTLFTVSLPVKLLDELEVLNTIHPFNKTIDKINIEFSDVSFD